MEGRKEEATGFDALVIKLMRFVNKVCLVTGGGSGIGRATSERLAAEGGKIAVVDINVKNGGQTVEAIRKAGGASIFACADVSNSDEVRAGIKLTVEKWEKIDVLVNNAGIMTFEPITELAEEAWERVIAVNLRSVFLFCKYALPVMPAGGSIVNVSSVHAHDTTPRVVPYATAKGGIEAFTRGLSIECAAKKVRVNCIDAGAVNTPMLWSNPNVKSGIEKIEGAVGEPEDIAAAICFLASDEARFVTGASLAVDGGRLNIL
ncbi:MAG TPA: SDR family NAD(P)-dependent oxidoreductase [Pyrinomonadaceae bacterium]|nr:SDR family NAD(P)-dependent oxidoreductase [Pyrinomonadaceae bacterium]